MHVKIVSYTQPVDELAERGIENAQELVAYCARVSNPKNQMNKETASKLVKFLIDNKHWSVFEMVNVCMEVNMTRDIGRQILRHRSFSFQEFSQRYAAVQEFELSEVRLQDTKNRQNSLEVDDADLEEWWYQNQSSLVEHANDIYQEALDRGIAKEVARKVLPEGLTMSRMYMNGTLRSWIHYLQLRLGNGTQKEHREIAVAIAAVIVQVFPMTASQLDPEKY